MSEKKTFSPHLDHAQQILKSCSGQTFTQEERRRLSIELATHLILESDKHQTADEKSRLLEIHRMMQDPVGKPFLTALIDQSFRSKTPQRIIDQVLYIVSLFGQPYFFSIGKRLLFALFCTIAARMPKFSAALLLYFVRRETAKVMIHAEHLKEHIAHRTKEGVMLNINHLGEAILGEGEAEKRFNMYEADLRTAEIQCISVKVSTMYSQISLLDRQKSVEAIGERMRQLYRLAIANPYRVNGESKAKLVYLDMEEYHDLAITKEVFMTLLSEEEFKILSAGIVVQAYLPDSYRLLQELTAWAIKRVEQGGAPIRVRIVKGANLAMEQFNASLHDWPQAPYTSKVETDANYKRLLLYALNPTHLCAVKIGIGSHNVFDLSFGLILRAERAVEKDVSFELLEGMANSTAKVMQELAPGLLMYCGATTKEDFASAIAYLIRRLDENTSAENYLRHSFHLMPGTEQWNTQVRYFTEACIEADTVSVTPRRRQNRYDSPIHLDIKAPFHNEPETDFSLLHNVEWGQEIVRRWQDATFDQLPCQIGGKEILTQDKQENCDPSKPCTVLYSYSLADTALLAKSVDIAVSAAATWGKVPLMERCQIIAHVAALLRERRADMLGVMMADGGKILQEADSEYAEAIDFVEYYLRSMQRLDRHPDLTATPKGVVLVTPPWNFPVSIPVGSAIAALITGNAVLFKPAPETVLCGYKIAELLWDAGVPKDVLQFLSCRDEDAGEALIKNPKVSTVLLTGGTATARLFYKLHPGIDLYAETGGKNSFIITAMADSDIAIKCLVQSAFGHAGQKCSAASIAILEKEVYEDRRFIDKLADAVASLHVGSAWNLSTFVPPLIRKPAGDLLTGLSTLDEGEDWLIQPKVDSTNPHLWSPGVKMHVRKGSYSHRTEFFGPLLSLIKADDLKHAVEIANATPYGLTAGIHTLDLREQEYWRRHIVAGNCYINRTITGAIVERQPFGGTKNSSFGHGAKAGGPNYLFQLVHLAQTGLPKEKAPVGDWVNRLSRFLERLDFTAEELGLWYASIASYAFWWQRLRRNQDSAKVVGQDNLFHYTPRRKLVFRIYKETPPLDYLRIFAAALTCETPLHISWQAGEILFPKANWQALLPIFNLETETEDAFLEKIAHGEIKRVRIVGTPSPALITAAANSGCFVDNKLVLANGRFELLNYLRETIFSIDYHRYGYLGLREGELRKPIL